jgi:UDP-N-acetylglucosamine 2-epimerase (non-hydrolysing)
VAIIVGTRPEAIKMAPVMMTLDTHPKFEPVLIATGQHGLLFDDALGAFGLKPDHKLELSSANRSPDVMASTIEQGLAPLLAKARVDLVLVQGDTTSALAAARAAVSAGIAVGHVEAGLRSHDLERPWPEEGNRIAIDRISTLLFAPTEGNMANLAADPLVNGVACLTGNSGIDALLFYIAQIIWSPRAPGRQLLVTLHRRETIGEPLRAICGALRKLAELRDVRITLPLHPNPTVRAIITDALARHPAIDLIEPLDYPEMIARMSRSDLVLSDSGGVQEEAPTLGVPLLILRDVTERPETVSCGAAILAGTNPEMIFAHASALLKDKRRLREMAVPRFPFGPGDASEKIVAGIENYLRSQNVT